MAVIKRKTTKTGPFSRRTITQSSKGTRVTTSNKPPGAATRRTTSTNLSTGQQRTTHTTKLGGGWFRTSSHTRSPSKVKSTKTGSRRRGRKGSGFSLKTILLVFAIVWSYLWLTSN
jgi:hypothetical protein